MNDKISLWTHIGLLLLLGLTACQGQPQSTSFEDVNVIPIHQDTILFHQRVIVSEGKIVRIEPAIHPSSWKVDIPLKAAGKYLIPGLTDCHFHQETTIENEFKLLLANGITAVSNMAERTGQDQIRIREQANQGSLLAPEYYTAGPYLLASQLSSPADAVNMVKMHQERGYDFIKLADNLEKEVYLKLLAEAEKHHIPVIGHGQRAMPLAYTLRMKLLAHLEELIYIFNEQQQQDTTFLRKAAQAFKASGIYVCPTLGVFNMISHYTDSRKFARLKQNPNLKYLPQALKMTWMAENSLYRRNAYLRSSNGQAWQGQKLKWQMKFAKMLQQEGVPVVAGTDATGLNVNGFALHEEFALLQAAGLSNYDILKSATLTASRYLNRLAKAGSIEEGKVADLVLLDHNPLEDIRHTTSINGVMRKGRWLDRKQLDALLKEVETAVNSRPANHDQ